MKTALIAAFGSTLLLAGSLGPRTAVAPPARVAPGTRGADAAQEPSAGGKGAPALPAEGATFRGSSADGKLQDALDQALRKAQDAFSEHIADAQFRWKLDSVAGVRGGITGARSCEVTIRIER